jgi:hypothetical protein
MLILATYHRSATQNTTVLHDVLQISGFLCRVPIQAI